MTSRTGKRKVADKTITEQGKYSGKYALTKLLICGECEVSIVGKPGQVMEKRNTIGVFLIVLNMEVSFVRIPLE